jgi:osmoprotectant transport system substrate-binding protein
MVALRCAASFGSPPRVQSPSKQLASLAIVAVLPVALSACGSSAKKQTTSTSATPTTTTARPGAGKPAVTLGTKNFTEELVLGQLYAQALRAKGFQVNLKSDIGTSEVVDRALTSGRIDGYPEYTGTILTTLAHDTKRPSSAADAYARAQRFEQGRGMTLLAMTQAQDTDVVVTTPAYARQHHLAALGDLSSLDSSATLGGAPEFRDRYSGLVGLRQVYGVTGLNFKPLPIAARYQALSRGQVQLIAAFTTDGQLSEGGFTLLNDPQNIFGFQNVAFVINKRVLAREGPAFQQTLDAVSAKLSTQALRVMNAAVDLDGQSPAAVATQFLGANGLI